MSEYIDDVRIPIKRVLLDHLTVRITLTGVRAYRWRLRLARLLFAIGGWLAHATVHVDTGSTE